MARVLFTAAPGIGHVHPMVPLALALVDRGHEVRWAVAPEACDRVRAAGFRAYPAGIDQGTRLAEFRRRYPNALSLPPLELPRVMFPAFFGEICPPPMLADLLPVMEEWAPDLLVHDAGELAAPIAAALAGVPHVTHGFGALLPEERVASGGAAVAGLWKAHGLEPRPYGGSYDHLYLDIYPPSMRLGPAPHVPRIQDLRPVPFDAVAGDVEPPPPASPSGRPLVYLTFGTVFNPSGPVFGAALAAIADLDVDVIVTVGPRADPAVLGPQPANVSVRRYVPQTTLLPECAAVVSHAGSGTVLACLGLGLPQVCVPQGADQYINAVQAAAVGAAVSLMPDEASPEAIAAAVDRVLHDPAIAAGAVRVSQELAAMPGPDEAARRVEALL